jgi:hypothetical protein
MPGCALRLCVVGRRLNERTLKVTDKIKEQFMLDAKTQSITWSEFEAWNLHRFFSDQLKQTMRLFGSSLAAS